MASNQTTMSCLLCTQNLSQLIFKFYSTSLRLNYIIDVWQGSEYICILNLENIKLITNKKLIFQSLEEKHQDSVKFRLKFCNQ